MKRTLSVLTLLALLGAAMAQNALAPLPNDPRFDEPVEFVTGASGESLRAMIQGLARSVGLTAITDDVPEKVIVYDIGDPKPFRQVWELVLTLNDLDYALLENDLVVVGPPASVARLRRTEAVAAAPTAEPVEQRFYRVNSSPQQVVDVLRRVMPEVQAEPLPGNTVVVTATAAQHDRVVTLLDQFDRPAEQVALEQRTYFLSNADATKLAQVLQETGLLVAGGEEGQAARLEDFSVVAEPRTNSIIVTGPASVQARLAQLIPQLDLPQRQVNIQVRIQEVTRSFAQDFGLDFSGAFGQMQASLLDTGLSFIFDMASAVSSFNIMAVLDALETQGLSRRVDDANITLLDKQTGTLESGGTVFILLPNASGEAVLQEVDYGVVVKLTPLIGADGRITINVDASVTDRLPALEGEQLHISNRHVQTTVTVQPGQTVLLGGLLQDEIVIEKSRLPVLGSIPVIGDLFGTTGTEERAGELLLIVTANIIE